MPLLELSLVPTSDRSREGKINSQFDLSASLVTIRLVEALPVSNLL